MAEVGEDDDCLAPGRTLSENKYFNVGRDFYDDYENEPEGMENSINDQLDFSQMVPRKEELQILDQAFQKLKSDQTSSVCLIKGLSGTGKSTLFHQFAKNVGQGPRILSGKFEEFNGQGEPLSVIAEAYNCGLTKILLQDGEEEFLKLRNQIMDKVGSCHPESIIPCLRAFPSASNSGSQEASEEANVESKLETTGASDENTEEHCAALPSNSKNEHSWNRMKFMFKALSLAIGGPDRPIILFIDDLQWCDGASFELLETLLLDKDLTHFFFFVGAFRVDEASTIEHPFVSQFWQKVKRGHNKTVVEINLENLSLSQLGDFLKGALLRGDGDGEDDEDGSAEEDEKRIGELAAALHPMTWGNIFFTRQLLEELYSSGNLTFSRMTFTWEWNLEGIRSLNNVLDAVTHRIQNNTSNVVQKLVITAAYMRSTFDVASLKAMIDLEGIFMLSKEDIASELEEAVTTGFLTNADGSTEYSFAHDRIQQAAYNMIPEGHERDEFRFSVGTRLYSISRNKKINAGNKDWMVYSAADHFNAVSHSKNPLFFTIVNVQAGKKCLSVGGFDKATKYFSFALKNLEHVPNAWEEHYRTALEVHENMVEVQLIQGNLESGQELAATVVERARDPTDSLPTQLALAKALGRGRSHKASFDLSKSTLQSIKMYPSTSAGIHFNMVRDLLYVKRYFKLHSDEDILALPQSSDKHMWTVTELYENTFIQGWYCRNIVEFLAATLKSLRATFEFGLMPHSGIAFMTYFMFCDSLGDMAGAHRFSNLGLQILSRCQNKASYCLQIFVKIFYLDSWSTDTRAVMDRYEEGLKSGMEAGDLENGLMCRSARLDHEYASGHSLSVLQIQFADLIEKESMYKLEALKRMTVHQSAVIRFFREDSSTGHQQSDFDALLDSEKDFEADGSDNYARLYAFSSHLQIAVYWGNYEFAARLLEKPETMDDKSHSTMALRLFFVSIACGTLYRMTGQAKYRNLAKAATAELTATSEAKGLNSWHRCAIASAHLKACGVIKPSKKGKTDYILQKYDKGREQADSRGHKQDAGLAAQLAAEYLMHAKDTDTVRISRYLTLATDYYRSWGATNLVRHLAHKHSLGSTATMETPLGSLSDRNGYSTFSKSIDAPKLSATISYSSHDNPDDGTRADDGEKNA